MIRYISVSANKTFEFKTLNTLVRLNWAVWWMKLKCWVL